MDSRRCELHQRMFQRANPLLHCGETYWHGIEAILYRVTRPYIPSLVKCISIAIESGLWFVWKHGLDFPPPPTPAPPHFISSNDNTVSLNAFKGAFMVLLCGQSIALAAFIFFLRGKFVVKSIKAMIGRAVKEFERMSRLLDQPTSRIQVATDIDSE